MASANHDSEEAQRNEFSAAFLFVFFWWGGDFKQSMQLWNKHECICIPIVTLAHSKIVVPSKAGHLICKYKHELAELFSGCFNILKEKPGGVIELTDLQWLSKVMQSLYGVILRRV